jgi:N-acetylglucosamine-6-sulfatase
MPRSHGRSWKGLAQGTPGPAWRTSFLYHYNYEKQFPYTPNVRGVRTARWKYVRYPAGDGGPDRHKAELFEVAADPDEANNRIDDPSCAGTIQDLRRELDRLLAETGAVPDRMPLDEGVKKALPDAKFR